MQDDEVPGELLQPFGEVLEVVLPLGEEDRRPPFLEGRDHVVQDQLVALLVRGECRVELLDARRSCAGRRPEGRLSHDETVLERPAGRLALRVHREADRPELHLGDRMLAVAPLRRRGQADHVAGLHLGQHPLERDGRHVVALVHDHLAIARDQVGDLASAHEALDHRHVEAAVRRAFPAADLADGLGLDAQEERELGAPLVEERPAVHQDERAAAPLGDQVRPDDRLADAGRGNEDADLVGEERAGRLLLDARQIRRGSETRTASPLSLLSSTSSATPCSRSKRLQFRAASPRKADVLREVLRAGDRPAASGPSRAACSASCRTPDSGRRRAA